MQPIRAIPRSDEPSDRSGGTPVRTGQGNYGSAPPHCESGPPPAALCPAWALATESLPDALAPALAHCRRPHQLAPGASCATPPRGRAPLPPAVARPELATLPRFGSHRWHWRRSRLLLTAWPAHHRLSAPPSRICRAPGDWGRSAPPFFCGLLGAIQQHLIPVDPLQGFIALSQLAPGSPKGIQFQPHREPALHGLVGRKARGQHLPPDPGHQDIEHRVQARPVVVGRTAVATPDHRWENRLKERPDVIGHLTGKVSQLHTPLLPSAFLAPLG